MFEYLVDLFFSVLEFLDPIWETLTIPFSSIPRIPISGIVGGVVNGAIDSMFALLISVFGDISLLELVLGASVAFIVGFYIIKFILSIVPFA